MIHKILIRTAGIFFILWGFYIGYILYKNTFSIFDSIVYFIGMIVSIAMGIMPLTIKEKSIDKINNDKGVKV